MDSAKVFLFNQDKLLLLYQPTRNAYDIPGGSIDPRETAQEAGIRETHEETGFTIDNLIGPIYEGKFSHPEHKRIVRVGYFLARTEEENPILSEHSKPRWERPKNALRYTLLDSIREALTYCEKNNLLYQENP